MLTAGMMAGVMDDSRYKKFLGEYESGQHVSAQPVPAEAPLPPEGIPTPAPMPMAKFAVGTAVRDILSGSEGVVSEPPLGDFGDLVFVKCNEDGKTYPIRSDQLELVPGAMPMAPVPGPAMPPEGGVTAPGLAPASLKPKVDRKEFRARLEAAVKAKRLAEAVAKISDSTVITADKDTRKLTFANLKAYVNSIEGATAKDALGYIGYVPQAWDVLWAAMAGQGVKVTASKSVFDVAQMRTKGMSDDEIKLMVCSANGGVLGEVEASLKALKADATEENIKPCQHCGKPTSFMRESENQPAEGQNCGICGDWICNECEDAKKSGYEYSSVCKKCGANYSPKPEASLKAARPKAWERGRKQLADDYERHLMDKIAKDRRESEHAVNTPGVPDGAVVTHFEPNEPKASLKADAPLTKSPQETGTAPSPGMQWVWNAEKKAWIEVKAAEVIAIKVGEQSWDATPEQAQALQKHLARSLSAKRDGRLERASRRMFGGKSFTRLDVKTEMPSVLAKVGDAKIVAESWMKVMPPTGAPKAADGKPIQVETYRATPSYGKPEYVKPKDKVGSPEAEPKIADGQALPQSSSPSSGASGTPPYKSAVSDAPALPTGGGKAPKIAVGDKLTEKSAPGNKDYAKTTIPTAKSDATKPKTDVKFGKAPASAKSEPKSAEGVAVKG